MPLPFYNRREDSGIMDDSDSFWGLSWSQRLWGFGICFVIGFVMSIMSLFLITTGSIGGFAVLYTLGNIVSIFSTAFLIGPTRQLKNMFAPIRVVATVVYLGMLVLTLVLTFMLKSAIITLILVIVQFLALIWYSASYIPYGREMIKSVFGTCFNI